MKSQYYKFLMPFLSIFVACSTETDPDSISDFIYHANGTFLPIKNNNLNYHGKTPVPFSLQRTWYTISGETTSIILMNINKDGSLVYYMQDKTMISGYIDDDMIKNDGRDMYQIMYCDYDKTEDCLYMVYRALLSIGPYKYSSAKFLNEKQLEDSPVFKEQNHTLDPNLVCPPNTCWAKVNQESKFKSHLLFTEEGIFSESSNGHFTNNEDHQWFVNDYPSAFFTTDENNLYLRSSNDCKIYKYRIDKKNNRLFLDDEEYYLKNIDTK